MVWKNLKEKLQESEAGKSYIQLVLSAKEHKPKEGPVEIHHIVPKSLRGSDDSENLVHLTVFDHIKAHYLLAKAIGEWKVSVLKAFECMCQMHFNKISEIEQITLEQLEGWGKLRARSRKHSEKTKIKISKATKGKSKKRTKPVSLETRQKISNSRKGMIFSEIHKERISKAKKGKKSLRVGYFHSEETRKKMSLAKQGKVGNFIGHKHSEESKEKMRVAHKGKILSDLDKQHKSEAQKKRWKNYKESKEILT